MLDIDEGLLEKVELVRLGVLEADEASEGLDVALVGGRVDNSDVVASMEGRAVGSGGLDKVEAEAVREGASDQENSCRSNSMECQFLSILITLNHKERTYLMWQKFLLQSLNLLARRQ